MIIATDVDQVVANTFKEWQRISKKRLGYTFAMEQIYSPAVAADSRFLALLNDPTLYDRVAPIEGALAGVTQLRIDGHRIVFVSSCTMGMRDAKVEWLVREGFLPSTNLQQHDWIEAHDKALITADMGIDDLLKNIRHYGQRALLFDAPYNRGDDGLAIRVASWSEIPALVSMIQQRHIDERHYAAR